MPLSFFLGVTGKHEMARPSSKLLLVCGKLDSVTEAKPSNTGRLSRGRSSLGHLSRTKPLFQVFLESLRRYVGKLAALGDVTQKKGPVARA